MYALKMRVFPNSLLSKWFRDTPNDSVFPVGETSRSRCNRAARLPGRRQKAPFIVGRGPSHATRASERVSLAIARARALQRSRRTGPRATIKNAPLIVGRGPVPRHRSRARPCKSGSPDSDPFVIRRSQTTDGETHIMTMEFAGETRSDARMASEGPRATGTSRPGGLSYGIASKCETPSVMCSIEELHRAVRGSMPSAVDTPSGPPRRVCDA